MKTLNRRQFIKLTGCGIAAVSASGVALPSCTKRPTRTPNIIYILADDLGYGDLSCYGQKKFTTPNIDQLAAEGMKFTDHYSGSTVCAPARASLMTGFHTGHSRVRGNYETGPYGFGACLELRPEDTTIQECLKPLGYATGVFGKWGLGVAPSTGAPWKKDVDAFFGYLNQGHAHFYYTDYLWKNDKKITLAGNLNGAHGQYSHDLITAEMLKFVEQNKDQPFFLYWAITIPHAELLVPDSALNKFKGRFPETPYVGNHYGSQPTPHAAFAAMVTRMDRDVGRLMALLKKLGIDKDTVVMFSSDNGPHKEGGHDPDFFDCNGPFKGYKRDLYEGGIRVPMIARWPRRIARGTVTHHISAFWDVMPTICELAGTDAPANIDGISFVPTLFGKKQPEHDYLYWEFHERPTTSQALRMGKWKAVRAAPDLPMELYDLSIDQGETNNIADKHPEIVKQMESIFASARTPHDIWPLKMRKAVDKQQAAKNKAAGKTLHKKDEHVDIAI